MNNAYVISMSIAAMIRAMGMQAENMQRFLDGNSIAYTEEAFNNLIDEYGLHYNNIVTLLQGDK